MIRIIILAVFIYVVINGLRSEEIKDNLSWAYEITAERIVRFDHCSDIYPAGTDDEDKKFLACDNIKLKNWRKPNE